MATAMFDPEQKTFLYIMYVESIQLTEAGADLAEQPVVCRWYADSGNDCSKEFILQGGGPTQPSYCAFLVVTHQDLAERSKTLTITLSVPDGNHLCAAFLDLATFSEEENFQTMEVEFSTQTGTVATAVLYTARQHRYSASQVVQQPEAYFVSPWEDSQAAALHQHIVQSPQEGAEAGAEGAGAGVAGQEEAAALAAQHRAAEEQRLVEEARRRAEEEENQRRRAEEEEGRRRREAEEAERLRRRREEDEEDRRREEARRAAREREEREEDERRRRQEEDDWRRGHDADRHRPRDDDRRGQDSDRYRPRDDDRRGHDADYHRPRDDDRWRSDDLDRLSAPAGRAYERRQWEQDRERLREYARQERQRELQDKERRAQERRRQVQALTNVRLAAESSGAGGRGGPGSEPWRSSGDWRERNDQGHASDRRERGDEGRRGERPERGARRNNTPDSVYEDEHTFAARQRRNTTTAAAAEPPARSGSAGSRRDHGSHSRGPRPATAQRRDSSRTAHRRDPEEQPRYGAHETDPQPLTHGSSRRGSLAPDPQPFRLEQPARPGSDSDGSEAVDPFEGVQIAAAEAGFPAEPARQPLGSASSSGARGRGFSAPIAARGAKLAGGARRGAGGAPPLAAASRGAAAAAGGGGGRGGLEGIHAAQAAAAAQNAARMKQLRMRISQAEVQRQTAAGVASGWEDGAVAHLESAPLEPLALGDPPNGGIGAAETARLASARRKSGGSVSPRQPPAPAPAARRASHGSAEGGHAPGQRAATSNASGVLAAALADAATGELAGLGAAPVAALEECVLRLLVLQRELSGGTSPGNPALADAAAGLAPRMLQVLDAAKSVCELNRARLKSFCEENSVDLEKTLTVRPPDGPAWGGAEYLKAQLAALERLHRQYSSVLPPAQQQAHGQFPGTLPPNGALIYPAASICGGGGGPYTFIDMSSLAASFPTGATGGQPVHALAGAGAEGVSTPIGIQSRPDDIMGPYTRPALPILGAYPSGGPNMVEGAPAPPGGPPLQGLPVGLGGGPRTSLGPSFGSTCQTPSHGPPGFQRARSFGSLQTPSQSTTRPSGPGSQRETPPKALHHQLIGDTPSSSPLQPPTAQTPSSITDPSSVAHFGDWSALPRHSPLDPGASGPQLPVLRSGGPGCTSLPAAKFRQAAAAPAVAAVPGARAARIAPQGITAAPQQQTPARRPGAAAAAAAAAAAGDRRRAKELAGSAFKFSADGVAAMWNAVAERIPSSVASPSTFADGQAAEDAGVEAGDHEDGRHFEDEAMSVNVAGVREGAARPGPPPVQRQRQPSTPRESHHAAQPRFRGGDSEDSASSVSSGAEEERAAPPLRAALTQLRGLTDGLVPSRRAKARAEEEGPLLGGDAPMQPSRRAILRQRAARSKGGGAHAGAGSPSTSPDRRSAASASQQEQQPPPPLQEATGGAKRGRGPEDKYLKILQSLQAKGAAGGSLAATLLEGAGMSALRPQRQGKGQAADRGSDSDSSSAEGTQRRRGARLVRAA